MNEAEYTAELIEEIREVERAYERKMQTLKNTLENAYLGAQREQMPANNKGVPCRYTFRDGTKLLVTYKTKNGKATGVVESTVEK